MVRHLLIAAFLVLTGCSTDASPRAGGDGDAAGPASLRLRFRPEAVVPEAESGLDQRGFLHVQVFDTPNPPAGEQAREIALYDSVFPEDYEGGGELALSELPSVDVALGDAPGVVFVRALFHDQTPRSVAAASVFEWGTWVGGVDVSTGFSQDVALSPVPLTPGETVEQDVPLLAMRRLVVTTTPTIELLGDGEGSLSVTASRVEFLPPRGTTYGYGIEPCVDLKRGSAAVAVAVAGSGAFFIAGFFDDLGIETPGKMPPGTMLSVREVNLDTGAASFDSITLAADQYSAELSVTLGYVTPLPAGASAPGPNSCKDLGYVGAGAP